MPIRLTADKDGRLGYEVVLDFHYRDRVYLLEEGVPPRELSKKPLLGPNPKWAETLKKELELDQHPRPFVLTHVVEGPDYKNYRVFEFYRPGLPTVVAWRPDKKSKARLENPLKRGRRIRALLGYPFKTPLRGTHTSDPEEALKEGAFDPRTFQHTLPLHHIGELVPAPRLKDALRWVRALTKHSAVAAKDLARGLEKNPGVRERITLQLELLDLGLWNMVYLTTGALMDLANQPPEVQRKVLLEIPAYPFLLSERERKILIELLRDLAHRHPDGGSLQTIQLAIEAGEDPVRIFPKLTEAEVVARYIEAIPFAPPPIQGDRWPTNEAKRRYRWLVGLELGQRALEGEPIQCTKYLHPEVLEAALSVLAKHRPKAAVIHFADAEEARAVLENLSPPARQTVLELYLQEAVKIPYRKERELVEALIQMAPDPVPLHEALLEKELALEEAMGKQRAQRWVGRAEKFIGRRRAIELLKGKPEKLTRTGEAWVKKELA